VELGELSAKYESNGDPGTISDGYGDAGGKSYGCYQFSSNKGVPQAFIEWLTQSGSTYGPTLANAGEVGSDAFDTDWEYIATKDQSGFKSLQQGYVKIQYYDAAVTSLHGALYVASKHTDIMQNVIWSRSVQYGVGNIVDMFTEAVKSLSYDNLSYVDDARFDGDMIKAIYLNVCSTPEWTDGSPSLRESLYNRFTNECNDALANLQ